MADFGGASGGVPFLVFLDAQGRLLINSNRPVKRKSNGENIGYPALPVEIDWFFDDAPENPPFTYESRCSNHRDLVSEGDARMIYEITFIFLAG
ncbi:MAG: hypothetical protein WCA19_00265 [Candidatus Acidiferrales bacterium]